MRQMTAALSLLAVACTSVDSSRDAPDAPGGCGEVPAWTFDESAVFPADRSLLRPEDGKALPDGRLVVADEANGLRVVEADGTSRPFGDFAAAGYRHDPPDFPGGATGVFLEDDGRHVLVTDIYSGIIYRVDAETESVAAAYDHPYGVNAVVRDRRGTIWFTQSTTNTPEQGVMGLFGAIDRSVPTGAVFALRAAGDGFVDRAVEVAGALHFANGLALDLAQEHLYVSELMMDRVLRYRIDPEAATLSARETYVGALTPDNVAIDARDRLWIASPAANQVLVVAAACRAVYTALDAPSATNAAARDEWVRRAHLGESRLEVFTPDLWNPLPGAVTGVFWSPDGEIAYFTGLGPALLRYEMP